MSIPIRLRPGSGLPLYRQIANDVKAAFLKGFVKPGTRLPSVRELARDLGTNPATVVKAYDLLESERIIYRHQGRGAFVSDGDQPLRAQERDALIARLASELAREGLRLGLAEDELVAALRAEVARLRPEPGGPPHDERNDHDDHVDPEGRDARTEEHA